MFRQHFRIWFPCSAAL